MSIVPALYSMDLFSSAVGGLTTAITTAVVAQALSESLNFTALGMCSLDEAYQAAAFPQNPLPRQNFFESAWQTVHSLATSTFNGIRSYFLPRPAQSRIVIFSHIAKGNGDLSACIKLFKTILQAYPNCTVQLAMDEYLESSVTSLYPDTARHITFYSSRYERSYLSMQAEANLIIHFPFNTMVERDRLLPASENRSQIWLSEYGYSREAEAMQRLFTHFNNTQSTALSLGANTNEIGLFIEKDLHAYYKKSRHFTAAERLKNLASLPQHLNELILGEGYSETAIQKFEREGKKLYSGYSTYFFSKKAFIDTIINLTTTTQQAMIQPYFLLAGQQFNESLLENIDLWWLIKRLPSAGIEQVNFHWNTKEQPLTIQSRVFDLRDSLRLLSPSQTAQTASRSLTIISVHSLSNQQLISLLKASEREVLTTGDHSLTEALALGKFPFYETHLHKVSFIESFISLARNNSKVLGKAVSQLVNVLTDYTPYAIKGANILRNHTRLWDRFVIRLYKHHNAFKKIIDLIKEKLF